MVVVAGVATAAIPSGGGEITGCYSDVNGDLRVVDESASCNPGESRLTWNQQGPPGPPASAVIGGSVDFIDGEDRKGFVGLGGGAQLATTSSMGDTVLPMAGTLRNLRVWSTPAGTGKIILTVRRNGESTEVSCIVKAPSRTCADTDSTVLYAAGDRISLFVTNTTGASVRFLRWTAQYP